MLTQEGQEAARECLMRSGFPDPSENTVDCERLCDLDTHNVSDVELVLPVSANEATTSSIDFSRPKEKDIPLEHIERV